ncbi:MAG: hypothetical protein N3A72_05225 [bacterium]|nr:hypothetical protein [bacterium]
MSDPHFPYGITSIACGVDSIAVFPNLGSFGVAVPKVESYQSRLQPRIFARLPNPMKYWPSNTPHLTSGHRPRFH